MKRKLIIGYDGSPNSEDALVLGRALARALDAEPLLVSVLTHLAHLLDSPDLEAAVEEASEPLFARARELLDGGEVSTRAVVDRSAGRGLYEIAEGLEPVAIVVGSAHRGPAGRILLGSVGLSLLSGGPSAIAVPPRGYAETEASGQLRSVAVAFSGEPESWPALETAIGLAGRLGAELTVLGAIEPIYYGYAAHYPVLDADAYLEDRKRDMEAALNRAMDRAPSWIPARRRLLQGAAAEVIAEAAEDFDLLVVGSRAYGPLRRALLGSVSAKLIAESPCPVLVVPRGLGEDPLGIRAQETTSTTTPR